MNPVEYKSQVSNTNNHDHSLTPAQRSISKDGVIGQTAVLNTLLIYEVILQINADTMH